MWYLLKGEFLRISSRQLAAQFPPTIVHEQTHYYEKQQNLFFLLFSHFCVVSVYYLCL